MLYWYMSHSITQMSNKIECQEHSLYDISDISDCFVFLLITLHFNISILYSSSCIRNKRLGSINQIMQILESTYFGKYFFEMAMVLRESLLLSSLLLNSEALVGYTDKDGRIWEQCHEIISVRLWTVIQCNQVTQSWNSTN